MKIIAGTALLAFSLSLAVAKPAAPLSAPRAVLAQERTVCQALARVESPAVLWALFACERR